MPAKQKKPAASLATASYNVNLLADELVQKHGMDEASRLVAPYISKPYLYQLVPKTPGCPWTAKRVPVRPSPIIMQTLLTALGRDYAAELENISRSMVMEMNQTYGPDETEQAALWIRGLKPELREKVLGLLEMMGFPRKKDGEKTR